MTSRHEGRPDCRAGPEHTPAFITPENVSYRTGFAPVARMTASSGTLSAAIWRFEHQSEYELRGPAVENTNLISITISGAHHHTYFGNGRRKWSRVHPPFHMNVVVAGEEPRGIFRSERPFSYLHVYLPHAMVERIAVDSGAVKAGRSVTLIDPMCSRDPLTEQISRGLVHELKHRDGCSRMMVESFGHQLAVRLVRQHSSASGSGALAAKNGSGYRDWRLRRAINYLEAHLSADVGLIEVADAVGLSPGRLTALFREGTGETPHRWLMNRRLTRACELLATPSYSVTEIAHRCGFASSQHLATVMRRRLATTPTGYRRSILT